MHYGPSKRREQHSVTSQKTRRLGTETIITQLRGIFSLKFTIIQGYYTGLLYTVTIKEIYTFNVVLQGIY